MSAVKTKLHDGAYPVDFSWQPASWWHVLDLDDNNEDTLIMRLYPPWGPSNFVRDTEPANSCFGWWVTG